MPFKSVGKEITRGTICRDQFTASVTIICSDRIAQGQASFLLLDIKWRQKKDDTEQPGIPDDAKPIVLTFRKQASSASGDIHFDAADGPTTKGFTGDTQQVLTIFGAASTTGEKPDVVLDIKIEDKVRESIPLSVGAVTTTVEIRDENGTDPPQFFILPETITRLKAVATPAGGSFSWFSTSPSLEIRGNSTNEIVEVIVHRPQGALPAIADRFLRLAVLYAPSSGPAIMAFYTPWAIFAPEEPGPFPVGKTTYTAANMTIAGGLEGWPLDIEVTIEGLIRYPAETAGDNKNFSTLKSKYPLVMLAHGRHSPVDLEREAADESIKLDGAGDPIFIKTGAGDVAEFKNFEGLEYLASHLASYGFVAVSLNLNGKFDPATRVGQLVEPQGVTVSCRPFKMDQVAIEHRALTILQTVRTIKDKNANDPIFKDKIDEATIGLIGHSRGGEAVVQAQETNKALIPLGLDEKLKAIVSIAPTDSRNVNVEIPYLAIVGTDDGDVFDLEGLRIYDRAKPPRHLIVVVGGIHNGFSSNWRERDEVLVPPPVSRAQHEIIAKGYINLFLQRYLNGLHGEVSYFTLDRRLDLPASVDLHFSYQGLAGLTVDTFEDTPADKQKNTLNEKAADSSLVSFEELDLHRFKATPPDPINGCTDINLKTWFQDTTGLMVEWNTLSASYSSELGGRSAANFEALSFRVGQDTTINPASLDQDFKVTLTDSDGQKATVKASDFGKMPFPRTKQLPDFDGLLRVKKDGLGNPITFAIPMSLLKTIRIPLRKFVEKNAKLKLDSLAKITFEFNEKIPGRIAVDDIEFSL